MGKKPRSSHTTAGSRDQIEKALVLKNVDEFLRALSNLVSWDDLAKLEGGQDIGEVLSGIVQLHSDIQSEGFLHYFTYSGDRWRDVADSLKKVGAVLQVRLLDEVVRLFPEERVPPGTERLDVIEAMEADQVVESKLAELEEDWLTTTSELAESLREYVRQHADELETFLNTLPSRRPVYVEAPTDDQILAFASEPGGLSRVRHALLLSKKLPVLVRIASEGYSTSQEAVKFMYAVVGNVGSQILAGGKPDHLDIIESVLESCAGSSNPDLKRWAQESSKFLAAPNPELALRWMAQALG